MDTRARSWAKSIAWRLIGIVMLGAIAYAITGSWKEMTLITVVFHSIRVVLYYFHERLWLHIPWGTLKHPLSDLPIKEKPTPEDLEIITEKLRELGYMD